MTKRSTKRKLIKLAVLLIILSLFIIFAPKLVTIAKYVYNAAQEYYIASKDFYFKSDKLDKNGTQYKVTNNWSGASTFTVTVNMSSKRNDKALTESDIEYEIDLESSDNVTCTASKATGTIPGTINNGSNQDSFDVYITPANGTALLNGAEAWVEVTATSTSPYKQILHGKLILGVGTEGVYYEIVDSANSPYLTLNVTNARSSNTPVTLHYNPQNVLLDMTSRFYLNSTNYSTTTIGGYLYINEITSSVASLGVTSVKFYKNDPTQNYSYMNGDNITPIITLTYSNT